MQIVDDGVGFIPQDAIVAAPGHLGLAAIRERAEMAGGWSKLWSLPGEGTTLEVWLPREEADSRLLVLRGRASAGRRRASPVGPDRRRRGRRAHGGWQ